MVPHSKFQYIEILNLTIFFIETQTLEMTMKCPLILPIGVNWYIFGYWAIFILMCARRARACFSGKNISLISTKIPYVSLISVPKRKENISSFTSKI